MHNIKEHASDYVPVDSTGLPPLKVGMNDWGATLDGHWIKDANGESIECGNALNILHISEATRKEGLIPENEKIVYLAERGWFIHKKIANSVSADMDVLKEHMISCINIYNKKKKVAALLHREQEIEKTAIPLFGDYHVKRES